MQAMQAVRPHSEGSVKFFPSLMRLLAASLASIAVVVIPKLIDFFGGPAPSDVSGPLWLILGGVVVFLLNYALSKIQA